MRRGGGGRHGGARSSEAGVETPHPGEGAPGARDGGHLLTPRKLAGSCGLTPTNGASSGGTGRGLAPGMGSEMTRLDLEADKALGRTEPLLLAISCTARSGILLGSAQACCHRGSFCASSSLPWSRGSREGSGPAAGLWLGTCGGGAGGRRPAGPRSPWTRPPGDASHPRWGHLSKAKGCSSPGGDSQPDGPPVSP